MSKIPNRFVGLHNHTGASSFDGLGYPSDHFDFCIENGLDAHAITEHGHVNSYAHAQLWVEDWAKSHKDRPFKYIPGVEAYFHPDLEQWKRDKETAEAAKTDAKLAKKLATVQEKLQTKIIATVDANDETEEIETTNALTIENEDETKSTKHFNPVNRRHHLVVLPKNTRGLQRIFAAVSKGYLNGFYRFPRIDTRVLREAGKDGDLVVTSACLHPNSLLITDHGSMEIVELVERVQRGDVINVMSYDIAEQRIVFKPVSWAACTRKNAKLLRIKLKNGQILKLTPDHQIYTNKGWIEAKDLTKDHCILSIHR
jgi:DNA polymerase III alpha subunit (gram-positive type)